MTKSIRTISAAAMVCTAMLASSGCSLVTTSGIDYSSASAEQPAGAPRIVEMTVTTSWPMRNASRIRGMDTLADGKLVAIAAPDVPNGAAGALLSIDTEVSTSVDPATSLHPIAFGTDYAAAQAAMIQIARGWAVAVGPDGHTVISAGTRYGVLGDLGLSPDEPGNFFGIATDKPGSPITPVTGACWFPGIGDEAAGTLTADGSNTLERRIASPAGPGDGRPSRVLMQTGPQLGLREDQQSITDQKGPAAPPRLAPAQELLVGGLADMACLDSTQVEDLRSAGVTEGLRPGRGASVLAVIDRQLADSWFDSGVDLAKKTVEWHPEGTHSSGGLVGEATAAGPDRLDAVAIDTGTGVAVAGFHLQGEGVADDAQITSLTLDKNDGARGWVTIQGQDRLYEFVIGVR